MGASYRTRPVKSLVLDYYKPLHKGKHKPEVSYDEGPDALGGKLIDKFRTPTSMKALIVSGNKGN